MGGRNASNHLGTGRSARSVRGPTRPPPFCRPADSCRDRWTRAGLKLQVGSGDHRSGDHRHAPVPAVSTPGRAPPGPDGFRPVTEYPRRVTEYRAGPDECQSRDGLGKPGVVAAAGPPHHCRPRLDDLAGPGRRTMPLARRTVGISVRRLSVQGTSRWRRWGRAGNEQGTSRGASRGASRGQPGDEQGTSRGLAISYTVYYRDFQKITELDQKITELEIHSGLFYACSGPRLRFPDRDLSYPKNVPTFF